VRSLATAPVVAGVGYVRSVEQWPVGS